MNLTATDNPENALAPILDTGFVLNPLGCATGDYSCIYSYDPPQGTWAPGMTVTITATCSVGAVECTDFTSYTIPSGSSSSL